MNNLVFGVGIGLFLILILWAIALLIFIVSLRVEKKIGTIAILVVGICTIVLIALPKTSEKAISTENKVCKQFLHYKNLIHIYLCNSYLMSILIFFIDI